MMNFASLRLRPDQERTQGQVLTRLNGIHIYLLRLVEKGESPDNYTVTLLLHYGEVHSHHDRSTFYRSARRTWLA